MSENADFMETGAGDPVLCLLDDRAAPLMGALGEDFRILAKAPASLPGGDAKTRAQALLAAADAQGLSAFALVAHGGGCAAALAAAALRPQAIATLVLLSPTALDESGAPKDSSLADLIGGTEAQALALFGTRSALAPPAAGAGYKRALHACHLIYVHDADDTASERLEAVSEVVLDFLKRRDAFLVSDKDGRVHA